jgi:hypothetical protein
VKYFLQLCEKLFFGVEIFRNSGENDLPGLTDKTAHQ